ncbi:DNA mismatch repair protein [Shewanella piezotolerans WP3]|uniref:DNA mismatch repair protein MutL n=1 Tax=Shewanella piezotolerans (strain WP3 / JCM 13877) TaxID=225849 RepID=MUTL_SHEPW|nr:DNA mismatch repair endonuclease MutL [Shewanella piezotolerans]B8CIX3.1 RecName: Full=DNA mismatch repair protein MutL [Shewanella piezotolerans WP3]ACJ27599.1 DNA mismatch repair protein [Shewanella piezotolerans WP3]
MAIEKLPPQLANQIAAGEVVERPASVIKELVENSLDAGATRVDIEIDKGGSKLIRIRDNGFGIPKQDLSLALSRHATSKLKSLDDLEAIMSFGFRGEALASISSVSRLTLTSRTETQAEAWQAKAEGTEMAVQILPAAHPVGTTIEAVDLFFNTPARRRFLKSDKTEFTHIDEWLKRIALVRRDIHFTLKHNGKSVRNYRPAMTEIQYLQRLGQVCGKAFAETCLHISCSHNDLTLSGYLQAPGAASGYCETQYFYVNGRLVKDRLVNHAVRQAFSEYAAGVSPGYVLMLELDPHQVDVNVHPAKHEVRFHQSRYVHDYILQALQSAMAQSSELGLEAQPEPTDESGAAFESNSTNSNVSSTSYSEPNTKPVAVNERPLTTTATSYNQGQSSYRTPLRPATHRADVELPSQSSLEAYASLLSRSSAEPASGKVVSNPHASAVSDASVKMPAVLADKYWVIVEEDSIRLLSIADVIKETARQQIQAKLAQGLVGQPLLMPVAVPVDDNWNEVIETREILLRKLGIELSIRLGQLIIKKVPPYLRDSQLAVLIPELLQWIRFEEPSDDALVHWLTTQASSRFTASAEAWLAFSTLDSSAKSALYNQSQELPWQQWMKESQSD